MLVRTICNYMMFRGICGTCFWCFILKIIVCDIELNPLMKIIYGCRQNYPTLPTFNVLFFSQLLMYSVMRIYLNRIYLFILCFSWRMWRLHSSNISHTAPCWSNFANDHMKLWAQSHTEKSESSETDQHSVVLSCDLMITTTKNNLNQLLLLLWCATIFISHD